ncbi:MAG: Smr/MutS family protein [Paracoccaceae bacterium]
MTGKAPENPRPARPGRRIGPEDRALWDKVTRDAIPLEAELRTTSGEAGPVPAEGGPARRPVPAGAPAPAGAPRTLRPTGAGKPPATSIDLAGPAIAPAGRSEPGLDRRNAERLRRGERAPDGRIDLHGMTAERAHRALDRRIGEALARGERLVLVITGKGGGTRGGDAAPFMHEDEGVLRRQAPRWLLSGPHAGQIVGIYQAHRRHGGAGAFYVYLKKRR